MKRQSHIVLGTLCLFVIYFSVTQLSVTAKDQSTAKSKSKVNTVKVKSERTPVDDDTFATIADIFQYDHDLPLEAATIGNWPHRIPYVIERVNYRSTHDQVVPALFAYPKDSKGKRYPAVLLIHGFNDFWGKYEDWCKDWMDVLVKSGRCVLVIDNYGFGERKTGREPWCDGNDGRPYQRREIAIQSVTDQRRGIDYLLTRPEVDPQKIGLLGGSMGAWIGTMVAGLDNRLAAVVLTVGGASSCDTNAPMERTTHTLNFAPRISAPVMMVNATKDNGGNRIPAEEMFAVIRTIKRHVWYESEHYLPPKQYNKDILEWFDLYLK